jgi:hypothetical protein
MWRCPHCGAPQAESARCWVCHTSSTTCSTCRHFQAALTSDVGWCGLDPRRRPLTGLEQRGCWQERPAAAATPATQGDAGADLRPRTPPIEDGRKPIAGARLDFIPVELVARVTLPVEAAPALDAAAEPGAQPMLPRLARGRDENWTDRTSLFGEPEA